MIPTDFTLIKQGDIKKTLVFCGRADAEKAERPLYPAGRARYGEVFPLAQRLQGKAAAEGREAGQQREGQGAEPCLLPAPLSYAVTK